MVNATKVLLTGGHAGTTALAVVEEIKSLPDTRDWNLFWIGARSAFEGRNVPTIESKILPQLGVKCFSIITGKIQRKFGRYTIFSIMKIPVGFIHAFLVLRRIKPQIILSFGGFAAFPVVIWGKVMKIPVVIHEQTAAAGRANEYSSRFARKIAISRVTSEKYFPKGKTVLTGNPLMHSITQVKSKLQMGDPPVIFVTGGSRGSRAVNTIIRNVLPDLLHKYIVVHQCGALDYKDLLALKDTLSPDIAKHYEVYETIDPWQMHTFWRRADIVVARSGANTVSEVIATKRPAIFIPLPLTPHDEQTENAEVAKIIGIATIIPEKNLDREIFLEALSLVYTNWYDIVKHVLKKESPDIHGSRNVVLLLKQILDDYES